jgi:hypothetical protein
MKKLHRRMGGLSSLLNPMDFVMKGFIAWMLLLLFADVPFTHSA